MSESISQQPTIATGLSGEVILHLSGPDGSQFLQGQTTADFVKAQPMTMVGGAFCDLKGRVLADFLALVIDPEIILLRTQHSLTTPLLEHLRKYLMFSKADLTISEYQVAALIGKENHERLGIDTAVLLPEEAAVVSNDVGGGFVLRRQPDQERPMSEWWLQQPKLDLGTDSRAWYGAAIARGEARIVSETMGRYLPQDLNYDLSGWVNFKKGCYTGQEVIARLHWRGKPKRRLYQARCATHMNPAPGTKLVDRDAKTLGSVVNSVAMSGESLLAIELVADGFERGLYLEGSDDCVTAL